MQAVAENLAPGGAGNPAPGGDDGSCSRAAREWPGQARVGVGVCAGEGAERERGRSARVLAKEAARRRRRHSGSPSMPIDTGGFFPTEKMPRRCASLRGKKRFLGVETIS